MNIYHIDQEIISCIDENGEVIDFEKLMNLQMERNQKCENIACWIIDLNAEAKAIKEQEGILAERRKAAEAKSERLKEYLMYALQGEKLKTGKVSIGYRRSIAVDISDESEIPDDYTVVKTTTQPDKAAIKEALKNGEVIPGCSLVERCSIQIK